MSEESDLDFDPSTEYDEDGPIAQPAPKAEPADQWSIDQQAVFAVYPDAYCREVAAGSYQILRDVGESKVKKLSGIRGTRERAWKDARGRCNA